MKTTELCEIKINNKSGTAEVKFTRLTAGEMMALENALTAYGAQSAVGNDLRMFFRNAQVRAGLKSQTRDRDEMDREYERESMFAERETRG